MFDYSIIPFVAMLAMNVAIFIRLRQRDRQYKQVAKISVVSQPTVDHRITRAVRPSKGKTTPNSNLSSPLLLLSSPSIIMQDRLMVIIDAS